MFNKSWKQINKENDKLAIKNAKEVFKALDAVAEKISGVKTTSLKDLTLKEIDAKLDAMLEPNPMGEPTTWKASYTADLCKHENFTALCPWCKPRFNWKKLLFTDKEIKDPIKTSQGIALILNHILTLIVIMFIIAYYAR